MQQIVAEMHGFLDLDVTRDARTGQEPSYRL